MKVARKGFPLEDITNTQPEAHASTGDHHPAHGRASQLFRSKIPDNESEVLMGNQHPANYGPEFRIGQKLALHVFPGEDRT
ncbi:MULTISPECIES: hypothetical protein [unclassified Arthrobacter]|uniref:hypothetical protein n=1 Tax=unclassified Arthrobacter TaxID=235627 RepID=UPI001C84CCF1|nr:hypothetical protein [Arthrobacter sp. MAHUQ-56]MBX7444610.1 hypothetical protein [Arthrobacter sp. MAHUQ-56]